MPIEKKSNRKRTDNEKEQGRIIRSPKHYNNAMRLSEELLEDERLSFKAKGIWAFLLARPDDWEGTLEDLINGAPDGKAAICSGLKELEKYGYL